MHFARWPTLVLSVASVPLNMMLAYLIVRRTTKELAAYSRMLMVQCVFDMLWPLCAVVVQPVNS